MTTSALKLGAAAAVLSLLLGACVTGPTLAPKGAFASGKNAVNLDRDWSLYPAGLILTGMGPKTKLLTVDGPLLNRLYVSDGLGPEDALFVSPTKGDTSTNPAPRGKANMSLSEQIEYVATAVGALDYQKVETSVPKPVTVDGAKGVRFEIRAKTSEGLNIRGLAQAVSKGGLNYYVVYLAPETHYYVASLPAVQATMDAETLK